MNQYVTPIKVTTLPELPLNVEMRQYPKIYYPTPADACGAFYQYTRRDPREVYEFREGWFIPMGGNNAQTTP
jgi:hypothetical protein